METPYQLGNFGNGTLSPGIDEAYAVIVEINAQSLGEIAKGAVFRLPFHQDGALGIKSFLHFGKMHDQVLLDFPVKVERSAAGSLHLFPVVPVNADNLPIIVDQRVRRMGDHKKLPPQPIHAQYGLHQFQEKRLFIVQDGAAESQHGPLQIGMEMQLRFINAHSHRKETAPSAVSHNHVFKGNGPAFLFPNHLDKKRYPHGNHEFHGGIIGRTNGNGTENFIEQNQGSLAGILRGQGKMEALLIQQIFHLFNHLGPAGKVPFKNGNGFRNVFLGNHFSGYFIQGEIDIKEAPRILQRQLFSIIQIIKAGHHLPHMLSKLQMGCILQPVILR